MQGRIIMSRTSQHAVVVVLAAITATTVGCTTQPPPASDGPIERPARAHGHEASQPSLDLRIPASLTAEHAELHAALDEALKSGGRTGEAAHKVAALLHPHFEKEEAYALPPLGLLAALADGKVKPEAGRRVTELTEKLRAEYPHMLKEHRQIVAALEQLKVAAQAEGKPAQAEFAETLALHAQTEEQVLYPAALVVGEYLKLMAKQ
jgi:hypothetical protein